MTPPNQRLQALASQVQPAYSASRRLLNRVAIVTGASSGFGREICKQFAIEGALVVCADLQPTSGNADDVPTHELLPKEYDAKALFVKVDVSKAADVKAAVARAVEEFGRVDM